MKNILTLSAFTAALICGTALCGAALAQNTTPPPNDPSTGQTPTPAAPQSTQPPQSVATQTPGIAPGSVIPVELTKTVDAKKAKTGDEVVAKVTQDMKTATGAVLVSKDTEMVGHVTEAQPRTKDRKGSEIGITFDHALTKTGETNLPMSIQAIVAPANMSAPNNASGNGGGDQTGPATGGATAASPMGGRSTSPQPPQQLPAGGTDAQPSGNTRPPINATTQGVIGMPNLKLEANDGNATQGSVVSSEKENVKLESGTLLLLRVSR
jgi:hypothetical protein